MRARFVLGCLAGLALGVAGSWACIPDPSGDFAEYQSRVAALPKEPVIEGGTFEASAPPTEAVQGLYYGACLSELAFGQLKAVFNFYTQTKYTPDPAGAKLELTIEALAAPERAPPPTVSRAGILGGVIPAPPAPVDQEGRYTLDLGLVTIPGGANPISGSNVRIEGAALQGRFGTTSFCARLTGHVAEPAAAARDLDIEKNVCKFVPIKEGDPTPTFVREDFAAASCPL
jgi:hypothetical protein